LSCEKDKADVTCVRRPHQNRQRLGSFSERSPGVANPAKLYPKYVEMPESAVPTWTLSCIAVEMVGDHKAFVMTLTESRTFVI
jgi:hypothetical protein